MTTDSTSPAEPVEPAETDGDSADLPLDDKAKFRAALERKRAQHHAGAAGAPGDPKAPHSQTGGGGQRMFRRKSG